MRTCINSRKGKISKDVSYLSTRKILLIIILTLLPGTQMFAVDALDEVLQKKHDKSSRSCLG